MKENKLSPEYVHWAREQLKILTAAIKEIEDVVVSGTGEELREVTAKHEHFTSIGKHGPH